MILADVRDEAAFGFTVVVLIVIFGPLIAQRLRLPGLLGLLVGGALIGPNIIGVLDDFGTLEKIGDFGVLYLLFLAGLQLDLQTFARYKNVALGFGLLTASIPLALGTIGALNRGFELKTAILIGSFWASFTLIAYPTIQRYGLTRNRAVAATIGASSITDMIGLVLLAVIAGSVTSDDAGIRLVLSIVVGLVILAAYCFVALPRIARWFFSGLGHDRELRFLLVLLGLSSSAVVADLLGIEPLIGAFFAGVGLNTLVPNGSNLMQRTDFVGNAIFIPVFLVSVGLLFDPAVMFTASTLGLAFSFAVALFVGKIAAAWLTGRIYGFSKAETGLTLSVSIAQAAATLAATIIGLEIGLYEENVVNAVMVVIALSLIATAVGSERFAPKITQPEGQVRRLGETVLVPINDEMPLTRVMNFADRIATSSGGVLIPLVVAVRGAERVKVSERREQVAEVDATMRALGLTSDTQFRVDASVSAGVNAAVLEHDATLILLGWPGPRDARSVLLGATYEEITASVDAPESVPVALAALRGDSFGRVLLALGEHDLEPSRLGDSRLALRAAVSVAGGATLCVGPVEPELLTEVGIELPVGTEHLPGPADARTWANHVPTADDLLVLPSHGQPFSFFDRDLSARASSTLVITSTVAGQSYASNRTLGLPSAKPSAARELATSP